ncbi:MAG: hypothetical protein PUG45_11495, partial [bacterium]|nr:hypothetical protein [bacterium]
MAGRRKLGSASLKTGRLIWPCLAGERGPDGRGKWPYAVKEYHRKIEKKNDLLEGKFENFPAFSMAKCTVWTLEFNVDYLFM